MQKTILSLFTLALLSFFPLSGYGHFGMVIPDKSHVSPDDRTLRLSLSFSHPFEGIGMPLVKPAAFYVVKDNEKTALTSSLQQATVMDHPAWTVDFAVKRPGVYQFVMEPVPYWEPTEDASIIHYTKVIVPAFGFDEGWDTPVGLPVEIIPLLRPFGNYSGNTFSGQVLNDGQPLANSLVEVELYNQHQHPAASDYHITQLVRTDTNGIFHFTCNQPGWWGFAALTEATYQLENPAGEKKGVELGGVLWVYMDPLP